MEVLPKLADFSSKNCSRVLGYSAISQLVLGKERTLRQYIRRYHVYTITSKSLVGK